jgi:hypothetical protein
MHQSRLSNVNPSKTQTGTLLSSSYFSLGPDDIIKEDSDSWGAPIEVKALQPQREVSPSQDFII